MSSPSRARRASKATVPGTQPSKRREKAPDQIHLPSVHVRNADDSGFDYQEDYYIRSGKVFRIVSFAVIEHGVLVRNRETQDRLCAEELEKLEADLPILMDEGNPAAKAIMEECAYRECARQLRIAAGTERACARCGCSETRACSGNCIWMTETLCSRCV